MKQILKLSLLLLALLLPVTSTAHDFEVDGIYYNIINDNEAEVTFAGDDNSNSYSGVVTIPSSIILNGVAYSVTSIGDYAFFLDTGLTNVIIPNSVVSIGGSAFEGCGSLISVIIPNSVTQIGPCAFHNCTGLTNVTIPNSISTIAVGTFDGCTSLTNVTIPNSVTQIEWNAFFGCSGLISMTIPNSVTSIGYGAFEGCNNIKELIWYAKNCPEKGDMPTGNIENVIIGEEVEYIPFLFVAGSKITQLNIPNSVTFISQDAFRGCTGLTSLTIPKSVVGIASGAFFGCNNITELIWNATNCPYNGNMSTSNIESVIIGNEVEYLPNSFVADSKITQLTIPGSVKTIGNCAFLGCTGLTHVTIPNSVNFIDYMAFELCENLTSVSLGNSLTTIGDLVFCESGLTSITIPNSVTSIGSGVFDYCPEIMSITVAEDNPKYDSRDNCNAIIETLSNTLITGCKNTIIPNSVTAIGWSAFNGCSNLTNIDIPNSVTSILWNAFDNCTGLSSVTIGNSITDIYATAFDGCTNLTTVICKALTPPRLESMNFDSSSPTLYVYASSLEAYRTAENWNHFTTILPIEGNIVHDYLSMDGTTALYGDTIVIPVALTNAHDIISFQTDIFLPEGLELLQEDGEYLIDPSERMTRTHSIISNDVSNGAIRVLCYSSNYKSFTGESGDDLFYLTVKVADDAAGDYTIQLKNTLLTTSDFEEIEAPDIAANVHVNPYLLGDANNSRSVTVTDVVVTSQYILEMNPQPFVFEAADVNLDGNITVTDVSRIAWMVLNPDELKAPLRAPAITGCSDRMSGEDIAIATGETRTVSITLENEMDYTAFQFDMMLPEGLTANNFSLTDRAGSHTLDVNTLHNGAIRALCYSPALTGIRGHEGALLTFDVTATAPTTGDIAVDGIELVTTACQTVKPDGFIIGVNNATSVNEMATGKAVASVEYYNLAGQRVDRLESGVTLVVTTYTDGTRTTAKVIK